MSSVNGALDLVHMVLLSLPAPPLTHEINIDVIIFSTYPQPTTTNTTVDNHDYYTSQFYPPGPTADSLWINLTNVTGVVEDLAHNISDRYRFFAVSMSVAHNIKSKVENNALYGD